MGAGISWRDSNIKAIDKKNESSVSWPGPDPYKLRPGEIFFKAQRLDTLERESPGQALWRGLGQNWLCGFSLAYLSLTDECHHNIHPRPRQNTKWHLPFIYCLDANNAVFPQMFIYCKIWRQKTFSLLFWLIPPICHQMISPPPHLSSLLNKLIGMVTLLVAHITSLPPPTKVYLLISCDVCWPATRQPGVSIKHTFSKKNIMSQ